MRENQQIILVIALFALLVICTLVPANLVTDGMIGSLDYKTIFDLTPHGLGRYVVRFDIILVELLVTCALTTIGYLFAGQKEVSDVPIGKD